MITEEKKRLSDIEAISETLGLGEIVQNPHLEMWLCQEGCPQVDAEWKEQLELSSDKQYKPSDLKRYEEKLKQATFNYNGVEYDCSSVARGL